MTRAFRRATDAAAEAMLHTGAQVYTRIHEDRCGLPVAVWYVQWSEGARERARSHKTRTALGLNKVRIIAPASPAEPRTIGVDLLHVIGAGVNTWTR